MQKLSLFALALAISSQAGAQTTPTAAAPASTPGFMQGLTPGRTFNPNLGIVLNSQWADREFEEMARGFSMGESEINMNANIDDKLFGNMTIGIWPDGAHIEEAYVRSLGLPYGISVKAGRMMPIFGYLNEKHLHTDDFVRRPLALRQIFGREGRIITDGVETSMVFPTVLYSEIGGGAFGEKDFSAYARIGGGDAHAWRLGSSFLRYRPGSGHSHDDHDHDDEYDLPQENLVGIDFKYSYSPFGNNRETELSLYGEYIFRNGEADGAGLYAADDHAHDDDGGFYAAAVLKWARYWRTGYMYSAAGHDYDEHSVLLERMTSEFGRFRLQYTHGAFENQVVFQWTAVLGPHVAHSF